jgi:hypothetical protein
MRPAKTESGGVQDALVNLWDGDDLDALLSREPMKSKSAHEFMLEMIADGAISPPNDPFAHSDPFAMIVEAGDVPDPRVERTLSEMHITKRREFEIDLDMLSMTPEVLQYVDNGRSFLLPNADALPYELARFYVPDNRIGIIKTIETDMAWDDPNIQWPRGDSLFMTREDVDVTWHLRLESLDPKSPVDPYSYRELIPPQFDLPGVPYPSLPHWDDMRFLWGTYCPVFMVIPPNTLMSLWIWFSATSCNLPLRNIGGRFTGCLQAQSSMRTYRNVTMGW